MLDKSCFLYDEGNPFEQWGLLRIPRELRVFDFENFWLRVIRLWALFVLGLQAKPWVYLRWTTQQPRRKRNGQARGPTAKHWQFKRAPTMARGLGGYAFVHGRACTPTTLARSGSCMLMARTPKVLCPTQPSRGPDCQTLTVQAAAENRSGVRSFKRFRMTVVPFCPDPNQNFHRNCFIQNSNLRSNWTVFRSSIAKISIDWDFVRGVGLK